MRCKIYTKKGDHGTTSLISGEVVPKDDLRLEIFGTADELCSILGVITTEPLPTWITEKLVRIQKDLFLIHDPIELNSEKVMDILYSKTSELEKEIDEMDSTLPELHHFIIPSGTRACVLCQWARTVCRRLERRITTLAKKENFVHPSASYINRLSDWLFVMARTLNQSNSSQDLRTIL